MDILVELAGRIEAGIEEATAREYRALQNRVGEALMDAPIASDECERILTILEAARPRIAAQVRKRTLQRAGAAMGLSELLPRETPA